MRDMTEPPPYLRSLYITLRPVLYGLLAAFDRYFKIENKKIKLTIEN